MGMMEGKSAVMPLSFKIQITTDETFKMRYITSLNSLWVQKYKSSKLKLRKKVRLSMEIENFFVVSNLTTCIFGTTGSSEMLCTSF